MEINLYKLLCVVVFMNDRVLLVFSFYTLPLQFAKNSNVLISKMRGDKIGTIFLEGRGLYMCAAVYYVHAEILAILTAC